jgi:hypothetical protein
MKLLGHAELTTFLRGYMARDVKVSDTRSASRFWAMAVRMAIVSNRFTATPHMFPVHPPGLEPGTH